MVVVVVVVVVRGRIGQTDVKRARGAKQ